MGKALVLAFLLLVGGTGWAKEAAPAAEDPQLEQRMMAMAAELRCLVCQGQSVANSDADLAKDMRNLMREKLREGQNERDIIEFMVARYGDFVLWRPPFKATTLLLWLGPLLLVAAGLFALFRRLARERAEGEIELSEADHARAATLLGSAVDQEPR